MLPTAPTLTGTLPGSPANDNSPLIFGTAPAGTTVKLYDNPSCVLQAGSPPAPSGSSAGFASPGITAPVADNTTTTFYATATDNTTSNVSACSTTSVTFVEDSTPPSVSVTGGPSGTTGDATPTFTFTGGDAVGPVSFQCSIDNGIPGFRACSGPGNSDTQPSPLGDGSYTFRVRASDGAGNAATATRSFTVQTASTPPGPPSNVFSVAGTTLNKKKGTATLNLILPGPGHLTGTGDGVSTISEGVAGGPAQLPVRAVGKKKKKLSQNGKVTLGVTVTYTPTGGKSGTKSVSVKLKKKQ